MIFITGDIHGDITRFNAPILRKLKKNDALIVCGDFGFIWNGTKQEKKILKKIGKKRYNILFVEGSHDNYDLLEQYETEDWCGGKCRHISGNLRQLMRGQVYEIAEKTVFAFGGGQSDDSIDLIEGQNYWQREIPTEQELAQGLENLEQHGNSIDFIVTYEPPSTLHDFLSNNTGDRNHINTYLDEVFNKTTFAGWFFGKMHLNKLIPPKYYAVYTNIITADLTKIKKKKPQKPAKKPRKAEKPSAAEINKKEEEQDNG